MLDQGGEPELVAAAGRDLRQLGILMSQAGCSTTDKQRHPYFDTAAILRGVKRPLEAYNPAWLEANSQGESIEGMARFYDAAAFADTLREDEQLSQSILAEGARSIQGSRQKLVSPEWLAPRKRARPWESEYEGTFKLARHTGWAVEPVEPAPGPPAAEPAPPAVEPEPAPEPAPPVPEAPPRMPLLSSAACTLVKEDDGGQRGR